jgi:hypothetical protein
MPAFAQDQIQLYAKPNKPLGFDQQQTDSAYKYQRAQAQAVADPRMNMKAYDKAGMSRGKGQQQYAASAAANAYAKEASAAEQIPLQDAAANANLNLQYAASQDQMALQLARIQEQMRQQQALAALQRQANASGFAGGMFRNLTGSLGGGNLLSGLMG